MNVYAFDQNGFYTHIHNCQPDPMNPGHFLKPNNVTEVEPPTALSVGKLSKFENNSWKIVDDPEYLKIKEEEEKSKKDSKEKELKDRLNILRMIRFNKLADLDYIVMDYLLGVNSYTKEQLKSYKQALKDITEPYKADESKLETLDTDNFVWPQL